MRSYIELDQYADRRVQERVRTRLTVRFGRPSLDREAHAQNVSEGGLYIVTNDVFPVGATIQAVVEFPEGEARHTCEVMWAIRVPEHMVATLAHGMGVQFVDPEPGWIDFFRAWKASTLEPAR